MQAVAAITNNFRSQAKRAAECSAAPFAVTVVSRCLRNRFEYCADYFSGATVTDVQPGMDPGCSAQAWMVLGLPDMLSAQAAAGFMSLLVLATVVI